MNLLLRTSRAERVFLGIAVVFVLVNLAITMVAWRTEGSNGDLETQLNLQRGQLQRLRRAEDTSSLQARLAELDKEQGSLVSSVLPTDVRNLDLLADIAGTGSKVGVRVISFVSQPVTSANAGEASYDIYTYSVRLAGNENGLVSVLKQMGESKLLTLRVETFTMMAQADDWAMDLKLSAYAVPLAQAAPSPSPTPTATRTAKPTATPGRR